jgi:hypothetical protein
VGVRVERGVRRESKARKIHPSRPSSSSAAPHAPSPPPPDDPEILEADGLVLIEPVLICDRSIQSPSHVKMFMGI